jgi:hypothetical protein
MADDGIIRLRAVADLSGLTQYSAAADGVAVSTRKMEDSFQDLEGKVEKSQHSMMEARHGVMLLGEEMGIHMPRAVAGLIASIGPIGAAMEVAFPILGALALVEIIGKAIEKHEAYAATLRKNADEEENLEIKERDRTEQLQITNLKLDDQIGKIEGRPAQNKLAIALLEAKVKADELATSLATVLTKGDEALAKEQTAWASFGDTLRVVWEDLKDGTPLANNAAAMKAAEGSIESLRTAMQNVAYAREKMSEPSANAAAQKQATADYTHELQNLKEKAESAVAVLSGTPGDWSSSLHAAREASIEATGGLAQMAEQAKNVDKSLLLPNIENIRKLHELLTKAVGNAFATNIDGMTAAMREASVEGSELGNVLKDIDKAEDATGKKYGKELENELEKQIKLNTSTIQLGESYKKLFDAQGKKKETEEGSDISKQEQQIKLLADTHVINESQKAAKLKALYGQERDDQVAVLKDQLNVVQAQVDSAQDALVAAQATGNQRLINDAQTTLNKMLTDRADFETKMIAKYQQFGAKIAAVEDQNDKKLEQIASESYKRITDMAAESISKMVTGQETPIKALEKLWVSFASTAVTALVKVALEEAVGAALHQTLAKQEQLTAAKTAASNTYAAVSAVPIVGPILAPPAAAAAFAAVLAFEGGGVMPRTGMAVLHENERIYTPDQGAKLDKLTDGGGGRPNGPMHFHYTPNISGSMDPREHGEAMYQFVKSKFQRMGYDIR